MNPITTKAMVEFFVDSEGNPVSRKSVFNIKKCNAILLLTKMGYELLPDNTIIHKGHRLFVSKENPTTRKYSYYGAYSKEFSRLILWKPYLRERHE